MTEPLLITDRVHMVHWAIGDEWVIGFATRDRKFHATWGEGDYVTKPFNSFDEVTAEIARLIETGEHLR